MNKLFKIQRMLVWLTIMIGIPFFVIQGLFMYCNFFRCRGEAGYGLLSLVLIGGIAGLLLGLLLILITVFNGIFYSQIKEIKYQKYFWWSFVSLIVYILIILVILLTL